jgi:hypothetical protein
MRNWIDLASTLNESANPVRASLERYFNDAKSLPDKFNRSEECHVFPNGDASAICTSWAKYVRRLLGNRVQLFGFSDENNPSSLIAKDYGGHDFALVDGRYIVDGWLTQVAGMHGNAILDMQDPQEKQIIAKLYGPMKKWSRDEFGHEGSVDGEEQKQRAKAMKGVKPFV